MTVKKLVVGYSDICANARHWSSRRFIGALAATVAGSLGISVAVAETPAPNKTPNNATEQRADLSARYSIRYLVQLYQGATYLSPLAKDADERPYKDAAGNAALAYLSGVIDSAEHIRWCVNQSSLPPREVDQLLINELVKKENQQISAAKALGAVLSKRFPCQRKKA